MAHPIVRLQPGESVALDLAVSPFWTWLRYLPTLGLWAFWRARHRFLLTNQRVIVTAGIITRVERALPLARIQDVTLVRSILAGGFVTLSSAGGRLGIERIGPLSRAKARLFADAVSERIHGRVDDVSGPPQPWTGAPVTITSELERLALLRERGAITDVEFESLKARLLSS